MPSVRVRRRAYSTISGETPSARPPLSSVFANEPVDPKTAEETPSAGSRTLHASRSQSRIESSLFHLGRRPSISRQPGQGLERPQSMMLLHGEDVDVELRSTATSGPGRIDAAINSDISSLGEDPFRDHDEDIVEHLEVIDPQVSTVATLTNAANSLLIPPTGFYSRRPVVALTSLPRNANDPEKASKYEHELDQHVDDLLQNRQAKIRRALQGLWSFLKTPMGVITAFYGFCVVFWGAAIVFFLGKIINLHDDNLQGFWVEVSSQVVNGLFTVTGIGFIPFRTFDTYRILRIWHYKRLTRRLRRKAGLPPLLDEDDLPDPMFDPNYVHVLTEQQQRELHRQQRKFHYSQSWYRPHGTLTHRAFPISYALLICFLNDANSIFQIMLCATMWSMNRFQRPAWSTGILIPAGFLCGIGAGIVIWKGGQKTRRTKEVEARLRVALHQEPRAPEDAPAPGSDASLPTEPRSPVECNGAVEELMTIPAVPQLR